MQQYLQQQSMKNHFWSFEDYGWVSYVVSSQTILLGLVILYLYWIRKSGGVGTAKMAVTAIPLLPRAAAFELRTPALVTTTANSIGLWDTTAWVSELRASEWLSITAVSVCYLYSSHLLSPL